MSYAARSKTTKKRIFLRTGIPLIITFSVITLSFLFPIIDSTKEPYFDLTSTLSLFMYWISYSGGKLGAPIFALLMLILFITLRETTNQSRWKEAIIIILVSIIFAGGGAIVNEHVVKTQLQVPRPNIIWLAGENGTGPLQMKPEKYYASDNIENRDELLMVALERAANSIPMSESIKAHWIEETGYSFPSGHSFSAMFFATFFLTLAAYFIANKRFWVFYMLLPWALTVCYSRSILRLHTPLDITVGGAQGLLIGFVAAYIAQLLIRKYSL